MFFRRPKPKEYTFDARLAQLRDAGFQTESVAGGARVMRHGCAAEIRDTGGGNAWIGRTGVWMGSELALLTDVGYQKVFLAPSGKRAAATAQHLRSLHDFTEDLRETLGLTSHYNEGLGTTNELHLYDRVEDRDSGSRDKPWLKA